MDEIYWIKLSASLQGAFLNFSSECPRWSQDGGPAGTGRPGLVPTAEEGREITGDDYPTGGMWG